MRKFDVTGMSCSACSARVQKAVASLDGVDKAEVNLLTNTLVIEGDISDAAVIKAVKKAGYGAKVATGKKVEEKGKGISQKLRLILSFAFLIPLFIIAMGPMMKIPMDFLTGIPWLYAGLELILVIPIIVLNIHYFTSGLLTPFYTIYMTITTGTMMGCFTTFFAQNGYLADVLIAPNEHGSLELPAAIVCSAAGMQLGMGWFFPGKLTRLKALMQSAQEALTMALAMMPFFMIAGFIESFITRHQEWPMAVRVLLMVVGLSFSVYYIILLPKKLGKKRGKSKV